MSLYQHCDVEDCQSMAEPLDGNELPDGWFMLIGVRQAANDFDKLMTGRGPTGEFAIDIPDVLKNSMPPSFEEVKFVICPNHQIPWKVRTKTKVGM